MVLSVRQTKTTGPRRSLWAYLDCEVLISQIRVCLNQRLSWSQSTFQQLQRSSDSDKRPGLVSAGWISDNDRRVDVSDAANVEFHGPSGFTRR